MKPAVKKPRRKKLRWFMVLQSLLVVFVILALAELALRGAGYGRLVVYEPDDVLYWRPRPSQSAFTKIGHKPVRIDSRGLRGAEVGLDKAPGMLRVLCLGDSRTFGWGLAEEETFAARTGEILGRAVGGGARVEVLNAGVNAWSYEQMAAYLEGEGMRLSPDVVVLDGGNLWGVFNGEQDEAFKSAFARRVRLKNLLRRSAIYHYVMEVKLRRYYEALRAHAIPQAERPDEAGFAREAGGRERVEKAILRIARVSAGGGAAFVLLHVPRLDEAGSAESRSVLDAKRKVAVETGSTLVDLTEDFARRGAGVFQEADPVHPNAAGNDLIAERLAAALERTAAFERMAGGGPTGTSPAAGRSPG